MILTPYQMMEAIDAATDQVVNLRDKYLRKSGWEHTCNTPGSYWMWTKVIDGRTYLCGAGDADRFQRHLDYHEMNKEHDELLDVKGGYCVVCGGIPGEPENPHKRIPATGMPQGEKP